LKQHGYKGAAFSDATLFAEPDGLDENELGDVKNDFNISLQDFFAASLQALFCPG
jgi:hypothetical protein